MSLATFGDDDANMNLPMSNLPFDFSRKPLKLQTLRFHGALYARFHVGEDEDGVGACGGGRLMEKLGQYFIFFAFYNNKLELDSQMKQSSSTLS